MVTRNDVLEYLVKHYFNGDPKKVCEATSFSTQQVKGWLAGTSQPHKATIEYLIHCVFTPQFKVIAEYGEFIADKPTLTQLKAILKGHEKSAGIYAFYDSMANLIYIGKANKLLQEVYAAIQREVDVRFPSGVRNKPTSRSEIVRYVSAYYVGDSSWLDYPKHVESLILRISKPLLNKNIGTLERAYAPPQEK